MKTFKESVEWTTRINAYPNTVEGQPEAFGVQLVNVQKTIWDGCRGWHEFKGSFDKLKALMKWLFHEKASNLEIRFQAHIKVWEDYWLRNEKLTAEQFQEVIAFTRKGTPMENMEKHESTPYLEPHKAPTRVTLKLGSIYLPDAKTVSVYIVIDYWGIVVELQTMCYGILKVDSRFDAMTNQWKTIRDWLTPLTSDLLPKQ